MTDSSCDASVNRRGFLHSLAAVLACTWLPDGASDSLRVAVLDGESSRSFRRGVELGLREANRTASLFHRKPIAMGKASGAQVLLGTTEYMPGGDVVYFNCGARSDAYRSRCDWRVFHISPSDAMYSHAEKIAGHSVETWSPVLERYGAAQLNDRFFAANNARMDAAAWCGWFGMKAVSESMLQMKGQAAKGLSDHLVKATTQFDGHKGAPLSFRSDDHQLRQPLYAIWKGRPPQDVPDTSRSAGSMRDVLDSIIPSAACR